MSNFDDESTVAKPGFDREPRWDDEIKWFQFPDDNTPYGFRLVAKPMFYAVHWIKTRKKDGTKGKAFPELCRNYDSNQSKFAENGCEVCDLYKQIADNAPRKEQKGRDGKTFQALDLDDSLKQLKAKVMLCSNAIFRPLQEQGPPANNVGKWTYIVPIRLPQGAANKLLDARDKFNKHTIDMPDGSKQQKVFELHHAKYGKDFMLSYNSHAGSPADQYQVYLGPKDPIAPLTEQERTQEPHLIPFLAYLKYPNQQTLKDSLVKNGYYEVLDALLSKKNADSAKLDRGAIPAPQSAPVAAVAPTVQAAPSAPSAFNDESAVSAAGESEAGSYDPRGPIGNFPAAPVEDDVPMFDKPPVAAAPAAVAPTPAPVQVAPAAAPVAPVQAAPAPTPAPTAAAPAAAPTNGTGKNVVALVQQYAQASGLTLVSNDKQYAEDLRFVTQGMQIPSCFNQYNVGDRAICKGCPIKVDCMMVS